MKRQALTFLLVASAFLLGQAPHRSTIDHELSELSRRGHTYRFLDNLTVEIRDTISGWTRKKSLQEPDEAAIRSWASQRGIPIIEIDPALLDTNQWTGWYSYWTTVPLSGSSFGYPLVIGDFNANEEHEAYGTFKELTTDFMTRVYEVDSNGLVILQHTYEPRPGTSRLISDVDQNGLTEVSFSLAGNLSLFEQTTSTTLPLQLKFVHDRYAGSNLDPGPSTVHIGFLDADSITDILYKGSEIDSITMQQAGKVYVAEYGSTVNDFVRVWSHSFSPVPWAFVGGFAVGEFDGDGMREFVASELNGKVFVFENTGDNTYAQIWRDSLPFVNVYYQTSGDVDGDGKEEFFVGATMSNGTWITVYEADSNNHYSPRVILHLLSGGTGDEPTYLTRDVDGNGRLELVIASGNRIFVFKSDTNDSYSVWYYKRENARQSVQLYDFNRDGRQDLVVSKFEFVGKQTRDWSDVYLASGLVGVDKDGRDQLPESIELLQNYPNPFNPSTRIVYRVKSQEPVSLRVYDVLGREVATLVNETKAPGEYDATWDARDFPSGVYFYRIQTPAASISKKMLLVR